MAAVRQLSDVVKLDVSMLEACDRTRVRAQKPKADGDLVQEYAEAYECGLMVEPLDVFRERGTERYVVADGEHRLLALQRAKIKRVECRLHEGDEVAALDFAIGCNHAHGARLTKRDRVHMFERIMETPLRDKYRTDTDLSEKLGVSKRMIAKYKADWRGSESKTQHAAAAKEGAQRSARKNSSNVAKTGGKRATARVPGADDELVHRPPNEQKTADWTHADAHAYTMLKSAWNKATTAARDKFRKEIA